MTLDETGPELDRYDVWGCIGEGGMSRVWLARHRLLAVPVIVKTLRAGFDDVATGEKRVVDEAKLMARIPSPLVVRAIDAGVCGAHPYLVEEYVDGIDLAELDRRRRDALGVGLPLWFVCEAMHAACEALHVAHQTGVIHRDVKPSNLFGSPQTGIRLGDFGIAAVANAGASSEISGTIKFMAPEQLRGTECLPTIDVWGAGATAFDLRYGRAPFFSADEVLDPERAPPFPSPDTPAEAYFQHLVRGMLSRDSRERPSSMLEPTRHFGTLARQLSERRRYGSVVALDRNTFRVHDCVVRFRAGDLTEASADAIVSSANDALVMRSGVADALRRRGGDVIEDAALALGRRPLGSCVATTSGSLRAKHLLHAVSAWREASCVGRATQRALLLADELGHRSLAFAALGTGAAKVSMETSASAMMTALRYHLELGGTHLREVEIVLWDARSLDTYRDVAEEALFDGTEVALHDVGLRAAPNAARPEGGTWVDPSSLGTRPPS
jgi:serine/threonine-protein kinase